MSVLEVMGVDGDTKLEWDKNNRDEVDAARAMFDQLKKKKYVAYSVKGRNGEKDEIIREFDPSAERIIMSPPMVGG